MSALFTLLNIYRNASVTEREKGTYFEELICAYLRNEGKRPTNTPTCQRPLRRWCPPDFKWTPFLAF